MRRIQNRLDGLDRALTSIERRQSIVLFGELGIGKSHLFHQVIAELRTGDTVVTLIRATPASRSIPFGALSSFISGGESVDRLAMLKSAVETLADLPGRRPHVIAVDDVPLLDDQSLAVLESLNVTHRVPILATARSSDAQSPAMDSLLRAAATDVIELPPLTREEAHRVVADLIASEPSLAGIDAGGLIERSAGNPLFLRELVFASSGPLNDALTPKLRGLIQSRIGELDADLGRQLAMVAACDPIDIDLDVVDRDVVAELERRGLVVSHEEPDGLVARPAHPLYGELVRADMGAIERRSLLADLSASLARHEQRRRGDSLRLANWIVDNGDRPDPGLSARASREALWWHDIDRARELAQIAVDDAPNFEHLFAVGEIARLTGQTDEGLQWWSKASELAETDADIGKVAMAIAQVHAWFRSEPDEAVRVLDEAASRMVDPVARLECWTEATLFAALVGKYDAVIEAADSVLDHPQASTEARWTALTNVVWAEAQLVRVNKADERFGLGAELRPLIGDERAGEVDLLDAVAVSTLMQQGRFEDALTYSEEVDAAHRPVGTTLFSIAQVHMVQGRIDDSVAAGKRSIEELAAYDPFNAAPLGAAVTAIAQAAAGDAETAAALLTRARADAIDENGLWETIWFERAAAWIAHGTGAGDAAMTHLTASLAYAQQTGHDGWAQLGFVDLLAFDALRTVSTDVSGIVDHARNVRPTQVGAPYVDALTDIVFALIDRDVAAVDEHLETLAKLEARWPYAAALVTSASLVSDGVDAARRATLGRCLLDNTLIAPPSTFGLSDRQREIAVRAAQGQPSRVIAQDLFLSVRTVDNHLRAAYRTLDVANRSELSSLLQAVC